MVKSLGVLYTVFFSPFSHNPLRKGSPCVIWRKAYRRKKRGYIKKWGGRDRAAVKRGCPVGIRSRGGRPLGVPREGKEGGGGQKKLGRGRGRILQGGRDILDRAAQKATLCFSNTHW